MCVITFVPPLDIVKGILYFYFSKLIFGIYVSFVLKVYYVIERVDYIRVQGESSSSGAGDLNLSRIWEGLARGFCVALTPHLPQLHAQLTTHLALRATIHHQNVSAHHHVHLLTTLSGSQFSNHIDYLTMFPNLSHIFFSTYGFEVR